MNRLNNTRDLVGKIAELEKGKKEVGIGQIREILRIIADLGPRSIQILDQYSKRRAKKNGKR